MLNRKQVNLRLPQETIDKLKEKAEEQKRSLNNLLEIIIDEYLQKQKKAK